MIAFLRTPYALLVTTELSKAGDRYRATPKPLHYRKKLQNSGWLRVAAALGFGVVLIACSMDGCGSSAPCSGMAVRHTRRQCISSNSQYTAVGEKRVEVESERKGGSLRHSVRYHASTVDLRDTILRSFDLPMPYRLDLPVLDGMAIPMQSPETTANGAVYCCCCVCDEAA